jgi:hypothetical protein
VLRDLIAFTQGGAVVKKHSRRTILTLVAGVSAASHATASTAFPADPIYAAPDDLALPRMVNLTNQPYQRMVWTK